MSFPEGKRFMADLPQKYGILLAEVAMLMQDGFH